jgi:TPR repeat protein
VADLLQLGGNKMPYNVLMSKIRCDNPNKNSAAIHNRNHFIYIGTREGTDLTPLEYENTEKFEKEMASSEDYVKYISKRPHSHGLFGNVPLDDIGTLSKNIYKLSKQKRLVYRGIVSLDPRDAQMLGYYDKAKWESYLRYALPDVAKEFGISVDKLEWVGAYHAEATHPHVHYMFWSSVPKISSPFIHISKQNKCRELLSGKMFEEERSNEIINKEISHDYIKEFGKELMADEIAIIESITPGIIHNTAIPYKIPEDQLLKTTEEILKLTTMMPQKGSLTKYKLMPPKAKEQINKIVDSILTNKSVSEQYEKYLNSIDKINMTYSPSTDKQENDYSKINAIKDLRKDLSNIVLKNTSSLIIHHNNFSNFAESILKEYITQSGNDNQIAPSDDIFINDNDTIYNSNDFSSDLDVLFNDQIDVTNNIDSYFYPEPNVNDEQEVSDDYTSDYTDLYAETNSANSNDDNFCIEWNETYKSALDELYNIHDYEKAIELLNKCAANGNVLAIHDLGKVCERGLGCMVNEQLAEDYCKRAFQGFIDVFKASDNTYIKEYAAYRIGKLFNSGTGVKKDISLAEKWFINANHNKYAQYSLAKIYIDKDSKSGQTTYANKIMDLLHSSSEKSAYASYELGNIYRKGYFTSIDTKKSFSHYKNAFNSFKAMLKSSTDDTLMYRVGKMYELGLGTEIDLDKSTELYQEAGKSKNSYALFSLAKIYLSSDDPDLHEKSIQILTDLYKEKPDDDMILYSLGKIYLDIKNSCHDINKAKDFLEKSASSENQFAQYQLGKIYSSPDFGEPNYPLAISYLEAAATQGNDFAMYQLGVLYKNSDLEFFDMHKSIEYFKSSADLGNQFAQYQLGKVYSSPDFGEPNYPLAISYLEAAAAQGNDFAVYQLGVLFKNSELEFFDISKAIEYFKSSADLENQFAQYQLGKIYSSPDFGEPNYPLAISYLEPAATQGNDFAMYQLGVLYKNSDLEFFEMSKAIEYFKSSADLGNQFAQYQLGKIYSSPDFGERNYPLSISYLEASAAQGNDFAMYQSGKIFSNIELPFYNMDKSLQYFLEASNLNNSFAQLQLGVIYLWGKGVNKDSDLGKQFLFQAINNGNEFAQKILDSYETYRLQYVMNVSFKLFNNLFDAISNQNDKASTLAADRYFRNLSKKAIIEEQLKNPHKHSHD